MKKSLLMVSSLLMGINLQAQFTNANEPAQGTNQSLYEIENTAPNYSGQSGSGVVWDYSSYDGVNGNTRQLSVSAASSTNNGNNYPNSSYAFDLQNFFMTYYNSSAQGRKSQGFVYSDPQFNDFVAVFDSEIDLYTYPLNLGSSEIVNSYSGTITYQLGQAQQQSFNAVTRIKVDGQGTLKLASNDYSVLRYVIVDTVTTLGNMQFIRQQYEYYDHSVSNYPVFVHSNFKYGQAGGNPMGNISIVLSYDEPGAGGTCSSPINVLVSGVGINTATVTWAAGGSETSWEVVYGPAGFDIQDYLINGNPNVSLLTASTATINLSGLSENTGYDVYVFAVCDDGNSDVAAPVNFTTGQPIFVATHAFDNFKTHPNPASDVLNIELSNGETSSVSIFGIDGALIKTYELNGANTVNVEGLTSGMYILTVHTKSGETLTSKFLKN